MGSGNLFLEFFENTNTRVLENSVCGEISTNAHNDIPQTIKKGMKNVKNDAVKENFSTKKEFCGNGETKQILNSHKNTFSPTKA